MITFERLSLQNFGTFKELHLIDLKGMVLLTGDNGTGKSTIPIAISWALFGQTPKKGRLDDVVNWDVNKGCQVQLVMNVDGRRVTVIRSRNPDNLTILDENDAEAIMLPSEAQDTIIKMLNTDFKSFVNATMFNKGVVEYLGEATPAERMKIFKQLLDMELFDLAWDKTDAKQKTIRDEGHKVYREIENLRSTVDSSKDTLAQLQQSIRIFKSMQDEKVHKIDKDIKAIDARLKRCEESRAAEPEDIPDKVLQTAEIGAQGMYKDMMALEYKGNDLLNKITSLPKAGTCDRCRKPITKDDVKVLSAGLKDELDDTQARYMEAKAQYEEIAHNLHALQKQRELFKTCMQLNQNINNEVDRLETRKREMAAERRIVLDEIPPSSNVVSKLTKDIEKGEHRIQELLETMEGVEEDSIILETVKTMFGRKGLPLVYTTKFFDFLNAKANEFLSKMPCHDLEDGSLYTLKVNLSRDKDKIDIDVTIRNKPGKRYEQASGGERLRIDLSLIFALNALCRNRGRGRIGALIFDEILDLSLDPLGESCLIELLQNLSGEVPFIMVISHKESFREYFPIHWRVRELGVR